MSARRALSEYPELHDLDENVSLSSKDVELDGGEIFVTDRRTSPLTQSPTKSADTPSTPRETRSQADQQSKSTSIPLLFVFLSLGFVVTSLVLHFYFQTNASVKIKKEWKPIVHKLQSHLKEKSNKFPSQNENLWFQISTGLSGLSDDPTQPAVYLLTYEENSLHPSSCIVEVITTAANHFILDQKGWSFLNGSLLTESSVKDPGVLIEKISSTLKKQKIIVVTDLQNIPARLAEGFHFLVDQYNPKVREAVYVLTLKIPSHLKNPIPVKAAEDTLRECWRDLKDDLLGPLITRVTNQVLPVVAENSEISCPLVTSVTTEINI